MANGGSVDGGATDQPTEAQMPIDLATMPAASTEISDLVDRLRTGRCVLCAGSRLTAADGERSFRTLVGKLSVPPTWASTAQVANHSGVTPE